MPFVKIKAGALIWQDHASFRWPACKPPSTEYRADETYDYIAKNPDMIFEATWNGRFWDCVRSGYGRAGQLYGNGSIFISAADGVEIIETATFVDTVAPKPVRVHKPEPRIIKLLPITDHEQCTVCSSRRSEANCINLKVLVLKDQHMAICTTCRKVLKEVLGD